MVNLSGKQKKRPYTTANNNYNLPIQTDQSIGSTYIGYTPIWRDLCYLSAKVKA